MHSNSLFSAKKPEIHTFSINDLSIDILWRIMGYLGFKDLTLQQLVSREFNSVANNNMLWKNLYHLYFKGAIQAYFPEHMKMQSGEIDWQEEFISAYQFLFNKSSYIERIIATHAMNKDNGLIRNLNFLVERDLIILPMSRGNEWEEFNLLDYLMKNSQEYKEALNIIYERGKRDFYSLGSDQSVEKIEPKEQIYGYTRLHWAVACRQEISEIQNLLKIECFVGNLLSDFLGDEINSINKQNCYGETPLFIACANGYDEIVKFLLMNNANVRIMTTGNQLADARSCLNIVALRGHINCLRILFSPEFSSKYQFTSQEIQSALIAATRRGRLEIVEFLLEQGGNIHGLIHMTQYQNLTFLHYAALSRSFEVFKFLLGKGLRLDAVTSEGLTILQAALRGGNFKIIDLLIKEYGINFVEKSKIAFRNVDYKEKIITYALIGGSIEFINLLIEKKLIDHKTLLRLWSHGFITYRHFPLFKYLHAIGLNIYQLEDSHSILHYAVDKNYHIAEYLLRMENLDINLLAKKNFSVFFLAVENGSLSIVEAILKQYKMIEFPDTWRSKVYHHKNIDLCEKVYQAYYQTYYPDDVVFFKKAIRLFKNILPPASYSMFKFTCELLWVFIHLDKELKQLKSTDNRKFCFINPETRSLHDNEQPRLLQEWEQILNSVAKIYSSTGIDNQAFLTLISQTLEKNYPNHASFYIKSFTIINQFFPYSNFKIIEDAFKSIKMFFEFDSRIKSNAIKRAKITPDGEDSIWKDMKSIMGEISLYYQHHVYDGEFENLVKSGLENIKRKLGLDDVSHGELKRKTPKPK